MTDKSSDLCTTQTQTVAVSDNNHDKFTKRIVRLNAIACNRLEQDNFDMIEAEQESQQGLEALQAKGGLQEMLAAQMLSIHKLQQLSMSIASNISNMTTTQYFTNTAIKLANAFTQQANLLSKIQDDGRQNITVGHVDVHDGGQAIVGNIIGGSPTK